MWVGFVISTLYFVLVKFDQCFGEPEPVIMEGIGAVSSIVDITNSINSLLSSAGHMTSTGYKGGIHIRHEKGGYLDAGMESYNCWDPTLGLFTKHYRRYRCPWNYAQIREGLLDEPYAKWKLDGPLFKTNLPDDETPQCLSFRSPKERMPTEYLEVVVGHCEGYMSQRWFIKIHEGQLGTVANFQPRPYFSIHSEAFPDKCLTKQKRIVDCNRWYTILGQSARLCPQPFEGLFLAECNGCDEQSFFIDASFLDIVKTIKGTGQVNSSDPFMALVSSGQPACQCTDSFDTDHKSKLQRLGRRSWEQCYDFCDKKGWSYNWCYTRNWDELGVEDRGANTYNWKYCSKYIPGSLKSSEVDCRGKRCKKSSPCGFHGWYLEWCYLEEGSWGYCSTDYDGIKEPLWKGKQLEHELGY